VSQIDAKIEFWRKRLLDLSKRNRLINCPAQKQGVRVSRSSIAINTPNAQLLWEQFANDTHSLEFPLDSESFITDDGNENGLDSIGNSITNQSLKETQKTLRSLMQKAKAFIEEKGLNALYLAFGFLTWKENSDKDSELRSPLLLVPVRLTQEDIFSPFVLSRHDEEIVSNHALMKKLANDFGIIIPDYADDISLNEYVEKVQSTCASMNCSISIEAELSLFSFLKINMYQDLGNNAEVIKEHPLIKAIAGDSSAIRQEPIRVVDFDHDAIKPCEVFCVVDSDSSQQDAIQLAKRGVSFVLQGPPGTGKSQTITNIIAELLSDGKRVLFVSEKTAALDVVHKRLTSSGLSSFCLILHSHNTKRRDVLDQLEASLKLAQNKARLSGDAFEKLDQLRLQRNRLNDYSRELHTIVEPIGKTVFNVNGYIASLDNIPDVLFSPRYPEAYSASGLSLRVSLLEELSRIVAEHGYHINNPWHGCTLSSITNQFRQQFMIESRTAVKAINEVLLSQDKNLSFNDCKKYCDIVNLRGKLDSERNNVRQEFKDDIFLLDGRALLSRCRTKYRGFMRIFSAEYKTDRSQIAALLKTPSKFSFLRLLSVAENLANIQSIQNEIDNLLRAINSDSNYRHDIVAGLYEQLLGPVTWFAGLFENSQQLLDMPLRDLIELINNCSNNLSCLEHYIDCREILAKAVELGIDGFIYQAAQLELSPNVIATAFEKCFYRAWLDAVLPNLRTIQKFRRLNQDDCVASFRKLDKSHMEISKAALVSKLISRLPALDAFTSEFDGLGLLKREVAKQRKLMPIRKLISSLPKLLPVLKPCIMMSPLSVSTYLGSGNYGFDTVIFDEASQVRTEDAICAIFRAKQVIIAGDSKQLPPTDFFSTSTSSNDDGIHDDDEEFDDIGAFESLLDEASLLPTKTLLWHYRSKHEHLIAFSNAKIYRGNLITFPSSVESAENVGVQYAYVSGGTYDRGGRNGNRVEAEKVAELVFEHFRTYPKRSLGVIAFGEAQQSAITDAILKKRREDPSYEHFFKDDYEEALFIKNLETVQGDERDTIIFSIGYAPDVTGKFIMNFGPLSRDGGERRLNVAITRARYNVKLVGSIQPTDIDTERTKGDGPKLLRLYIDFAINGAKAMLGEIIDNKAISFDSPFEKAIYDFLRGRGYEIATQVGCSGYRIDLAVRHPKYNGRFAIGIECDGAAYHSARTARERDRLRQAVLEDMGWKIYRVWSTAWIKDSVSEGEKLISAIEDAIACYSETIATETVKPLPMTDYLTIENRPQIPTGLPRTSYYGYKAEDIPTKDFEITMLQIVTQSYGINKEGLMKATASCYGWQRRGEVIKSRLESAYRRLLSSGRIKETDGKVEES